MIHATDCGPVCPGAPLKKCGTRPGEGIYSYSIVAGRPGHWRATCYLCHIHHYFDAPGTNVTTPIQELRQAHQSAADEGRLLDGSNQRYPGAAYLAGMKAGLPAF